MHSGKGRYMVNVFLMFCGVFRLFPIVSMSFFFFFPQDVFVNFMSVSMSVHYTYADTLGTGVTGGCELLVAGSVQAYGEPLSRPPSLWL